MEFKDYYEILQVSRNASEDVIKMAYKALVKRYHPDINSGNSDYYNNKIREINEAYSVLGEKYNKEKYDYEYDYIKKKENNDTQSYYENKSTSRDNEGKKKSKSFFNYKKLIVIGATFFIIFSIFRAILYSYIDYSKEAKNLVIEEHISTSELIRKSNYEVGEKNLIIYGFDVQKVNRNIYFVSWNFDDNDLKDDGWYMYCFEVNIRDSSVESIEENNYLELKYRALGFID